MKMVPLYIMLFAYLEIVMNNKIIFFVNSRFIVSGCDIHSYLPETV